MGAYLSSPITEKQTEEGESAALQYGVAAMQGWRRTMEDGKASLPTRQPGPVFAGPWAPFAHDGRTLQLRMISMTT